MKKETNNMREELLKAIDAQDFETIINLIDLGVDVHLEKDLKEAIVSSDFEKVKSLVEAGACLRFREYPDEHNILHFAIQFANDEILNYLYNSNKKALSDEIYWQNDNSRFGVSIPCLFDRVDFLKVVYNDGLVDIEIYDCIDTATSLNASRCIDFLLKKHPEKMEYALINTVQNNKFELLKHIVDKFNYDLNSVKGECYGLLSWACINFNLDMVKYLVEYGVDINDNASYWFKGSSPLHWLEIAYEQYCMKNTDSVSIIIKGKEIERTKRKYQEIKEYLISQGAKDLFVVEQIA